MVLACSPARRYALEALVACAGVTLGVVASAIGIEITNGSAIAEGDPDFRGTLGGSKESAVGFTAVRLAFNLHTNVTAAQMASLSKRTERNSVVYQTLAKGVPLATSFTAA